MSCGPSAQMNLQRFPPHHIILRLYVVGCRQPIILFVIQIEYLYCRAHSRSLRAQYWCVNFTLLMLWGDVMALTPYF